MVNGKFISSTVGCVQRGRAVLRRKVDLERRAPGSRQHYSGPWVKSENSMVRAKPSKTDAKSGSEIAGQGRRREKIWWGAGGEGGRRLGEGEYAGSW